MDWPAQSLHNGSPGREGTRDTSLLSLCTNCSFNHVAGFPLRGGEGDRITCPLSLRLISLVRRSRGNWEGSPTGDETPRHPGSWIWNDTIARLARRIGGTLMALARGVLSGHRKRFRVPREQRIGNVRVEAHSCQASPRILLDAYRARCDAIMESTRDSGVWEESWCDRTSWLMSWCGYE